MVSNPNNQKDLLAADSLIKQTEKEISSEPDTSKAYVFKFRKHIQAVTKSVKGLMTNKDLQIPVSDQAMLKSASGDLGKVTDYAPVWVIATISISLGIGTMIGWKRIVVTIGEKIGKEHLNYAQGATAELVAASTIGLSTGFGLPVSTTHVLSSGIAGAMVASNGTKNLNNGTLKNIALAWVLTLPVSIVLAMVLFVLFHLFI
jgi:PiT family inorganic phosphate transporter